MRVRNPFVLSSVLTLVATIGGPQWALAADDKEACLAAADQGQSLRDDGKYSEAREQFVGCAKNTCPKLVQDQCADWLRELDESMPTVVFAVKDDRGNDVTAVHVTADEKHLSGVIVGKPVPLDPGPHDIRFERDNPSQSVSIHVVLRAGEKNRDVDAVFPPLEAPPPEKPPEESPTSPPPASPPAAEAAPELPPPPPPSTGDGRRVTSIPLLAGAALGVGLGAYFGIQSQNEASDADSTEKSLGRGGCGANGNPADPRCKVLNDSRDAQNRDATLDVVLYAAGGALAAGALAAWFLWPKPTATTKASAAWVVPSIAANGVGFCAGGDF